jgi:DMSO/TMAO reductase YedYZ molybdopterin-dependent catalytic subunit
VEVADPTVDAPAVPTGRASRSLAAAAGLFASGAALGTSELLSGLSARIPSLVLGVADLVVAETPGGIVRWSIRTFGTNQKAVLVTGIVAVSLLLGAAFGVAARTRFARGATGFAAFGLLGGWAAARGLLTSDGWGWLAAFLSATAGVAALRVLQPRTRPARPAPGVAPTAGGRGTAVDRRRFLVASGALAAWGVAGAGVGRLLRQARNVEAARQRLAARLGSGPPALPANVETFDGEIPGISPIVTPNANFYRIDTRILAPQVDPGGWSLQITGMVAREVELSFDELLAMDRISEYVTLSCVSNEVGGDLVGNALWSGVPLTSLLDRAGSHRDATQIVGRAVDGWTAGFPTEVVADGRPCMVAVTMNGEPLPVKHGFPARLIIPGLYGYVSATKWLTEIELTTWEAFDGYWIPRGWAKQGPIKTQSRIDVPRPGATLTAGPTAIAGVAWAPTREIERVEVRVDDGRWQSARLSGALSEHTWVQWTYAWEATPGAHRLQVRATDGDGNTQTGELAPPAPSGATGYHTIRVEVT